MKMANNEIMAINKLSIMCNNNNVVIMCNVENGNNNEKQWK
jgi:hypothetical protein